MQFLDCLIGAKSTLNTYSSLFKSHIEPILSPEEAFKANEWIINNIVRQWQAKGLSPSTMNTLIILLGKYIKFHNGRADTEAASKVIRTMNHQKKVNCLNYEEYRIFLKCLLEEDDAEFVLTMLFAATAGMRRGEIYNLRWEDINLEKGVLSVSKTKTGTPRIVKISNLLKLRLIERNHYNKPESLILRLKNPNKQLKKFCRRIGVREISIHGLRHTFATSGLDHNVSIKDMQQALGHAAATTTLNIYWNHVGTELDMDEFIPKGV